MNLDPKCRRKGMYAPFSVSFLHPHDVIKDLDAVESSAFTTGAPESQK